MKRVTLFTDGACLDNPGPGGWAALLRYGKHEKMLSGSEEMTTNNRMEIMAVIQGLRVLNESCEVEVVVDSRYVMDAFDKHWLRNWKANGWKTAAKKDVKNQDLWELLDIEVQRHRLRWTWVRGHTGHAENEMVDKEARIAAEAARKKKSSWTRNDESGSGL